ncbi:MAG: MotA/TolQ/ExbB proton channel family protein [Mangrovicoccus sp.]
MMALGLTQLRGLVEMGGLVVAVLLACSVLALAVIFWKFALFELCAIGRSRPNAALAEILAQARRARAGGLAPDALRPRILARIEKEQARFGKGLGLLDLLSQICPLLGLFGTVLGMIDAFRTLQEAGSSADPSLLAGGIWVALLTTAAGLVVAMPCAACLAWFDARLAAYRRLAEEGLEEILAPGIFPSGVFAENKAQSAAAGVGEGPAYV